MHISNHNLIAYLAPEIPALSATFVHEELHGLELLGHPVMPFSVHRPKMPAKNESALGGRTRYLYDCSKMSIVLGGLLNLYYRPGAIKALSWLMKDVVECGLFKAVSWKLTYQFFAAIRLSKRLEESQCKHLHIHFAHVPAQIGMYASALSGIPFTIMAHANDIFERGLLLKQKADRAVKLVTISEYNRVYLESIGVPKDKIAIVRCGVSFPIRPPVRSSEPRDSYRLGTLGRMVEKKGMDVLIRALAALKGRPYSIRLCIAGDGPLQDDLKSLAKALGVAESVCFEGGLSHAEVAPWMQGLDAFVLACKKDANGDMDGIPVVLMEAMSQSVPVISTRLSGIPELIVHEKTGLLAMPDDCQDLAEQIDRMLQSSELRECLISGAVDHVQQEFGQKVNLDRLMEYVNV